MGNDNRRRCLIRVGLLAALTLPGCVDGPLYNLKRINPYYTSQWKADREHGPTFEDRYDELLYVEKRLPALDTAEQLEWANRLAAVVKDTPSAEMRVKAVEILGQLKSTAVTEALNVASVDEVEKVRLAACIAWGQQRTPEARDMLLSISQREDETTSVRQHAIENLALFAQPEVELALGRLLDDKSPAIQYQVTQSLQQVSGQEYGGDLDSWRQYLASKQPSTSSQPQGILAGSTGASPVGTASATSPAPGNLPSDPPSLGQSNYPALPDFR